MRRNLKAAVGLALVAVFSTGAVALAGVVHPTLISPKGKVNPGHIKLVVKDTGAKGKIAVFVQIERKKHLDKYGHLKLCTSSSNGCDFVELKRVKGRPGYWSYKSPVYTFAGWWSTTPGKYYWQADHADCSIRGCEAVSKIGSFTVR